ncbi:hypothetical protein AB0G04_24560 [Actinoplanes sp. NPDC023801]|uniref:hypothetical protein n=1 Tax=Actinoplanes sp. NPDC023801 TaxID=3154595 RepID=UPI0033D22038
MGFRISHKLLLLGLGSVLVTAVVLVAVGAWQCGRFADNTEREVLRQNRSRSRRVPPTPAPWSRPSATRSSRAWTGA